MAAHRPSAPGGYTTVSIDLLFRQPDGRAWRPGTISARFKAAAEAAGLPPIRFHDGQHAAATYTKAAGGDLLDLRKKLGHASVTVTADHYPAHEQASESRREKSDFTEQWKSSSAHQ